MASANTTDTPAVDDQILKGKLAWNNNNNNYTYPPVASAFHITDHAHISCIVSHSKNQHTTKEGFGQPNYTSVRFLLISG